LERNEVATYLPLLLAVAGFLVAALLSERALTILSVEQKAQVLDAFSAARKIHILVIVAFILLALWWPLAAWTFIAVYFVGAAIWGARRLAGLRLPQPAHKYFMLGQCAVATGVVSCAVVVMTRSMWL
jgi:hypothetical protein